MTPQGHVISLAILPLCEFDLVCCAGATGDLIPLEILPLGEFDPVYRSTLEVQAGELPVLPLSIYGSVRIPHPGFYH